jgi:hypothetical protein
MRTPSRHTRGRLAADGWSIVEALIACALVGILAVELTAVAHYVSFAQANEHKSEAIVDAMNHVYGAFGDDDAYCYKILGGLPLAVDQIAAGGVATTVPSITYNNLLSASVGTALSASSPSVEGVAKLAVSKIELAPVAPISASEILASLNVTFAKADALGSPVSVRKIPVYAQVQNGMVLYCSILASSTLALNRFLCDVNSAGAQTYDITFNPATNPGGSPCIDIPGKSKWYYGATPILANCPGTTQIAIAPQDGALVGNVCASTGVPPLPGPSRSYTDGSTINTFAPSNATLLANGCSFDYVAGTNFGGPPPVRSEVKCVQN